MNISDVDKGRLDKLCRMISKSNYISEINKQPFYTLIGDRLLSRSKLLASMAITKYNVDKNKPEKYYIISGIKFKDTCAKYSDVIDLNDLDFLEDLYSTVKHETIKKNIGKSIKNSDSKSMPYYFHKCKES